MDFSDEPFADLDELLSQLDARIQERLPAVFKRLPRRVWERKARYFTTSLVPSRTRLRPSSLNVATSVDGSFAVLVVPRL